MKELSIEEKAKAYDNLIERLKDFQFGYRFSAFSDTIEEFFPELKESEDKKIKEGLIDYFNNFHLQTFAGLEPKKILAWLEKQGEQKPADKVEPKFKVEEEKQEWSEEDEEMRLDAIKYLELFDAQGIHGNNAVPCINWLKSLRPQNAWKPSEEQMNALRYVTNFNYGGYKATLVSLYEQLKKLKE